MIGGEGERLIWDEGRGNNEHTRYQMHKAPTGLRSPFEARVFKQPSARITYGHSVISWELSSGRAGPTRLLSAVRMDIIWESSGHLRGGIQTEFNVRSLLILCFL